MTGQTWDIIWQSLTIFLLASALDWAWTRYNQLIVAEQSVPAGAFGALITFFSAGTVLIYTGSPWMILPFMAGSFFGTWFTVENHRRK